MIGDGVRLQMLLGNLPAPAPFEVVNALAEATIRNGGEGQDGFQLRFQVARGGSDDFQLVNSGELAPQTRVIIMVFVGLQPTTLIDGIITHHQLVPSNHPGQSTLLVTGLDISQKLNLEEKNATHPNQPDSEIVRKIVLSHRLVPDVTATRNVPTELRRIPSQHETDFQYIQRLARRNSFVFYVEPTLVPGVTKAVWGKEQRSGSVQPSLNINMGSFTNVDQLHFGFDAMARQNPAVTIIEPFTKTPIRIPIPNLLNPSLSSITATALRTTIARDTAGLDPIEATLRALQMASQGSDAATGRGTVDVVRYGRVLQARRLVGVRGVGRTHDGEYYVKQVTHKIKRGEYKQEFELVRDGLGTNKTRLAS